MRPADTQQKDTQHPTLLAEDDFYIMRITGGLAVALSLLRALMTFQLCKSREHSTWIQQKGLLGA